MSKQDLSTMTDISVRFHPGSVRNQPTWIAHARPQGFDFYLTGFGVDANEAVTDLLATMNKFFQEHEPEEE